MMQKGTGQHLGAMQNRKENPDDCLLNEEGFPNLLKSGHILIVCVGCREHRLSLNSRVAAIVKCVCQPLTTLLHYTGVPIRRRLLKTPKM